MTSPSPADLSKLRINRDVPPPGVTRALRRNLVLAAGALLLLGGAYFALRGGGAVPVQVVTAEPLSGSEGGGTAAGATTVTANGYVVARTRASVSAKLAGRIADLRVSEGSELREGEIIARLENDDYKAQSAQADAALATAKADLLEARAASDVAAREASRLSSIRTENQDLVAEQELDNVVGRAAQAEARVASAQARIEAAEAGRRFARANLENTIIRAPFTGTVLRKEAEIGEVVAPSVGGGLTRGAVVTMADLKTLEVEVDVNEAYIARVQKGGPARITLDAYPDTSFRGAGPPGGADRRPPARHRAGEGGHPRARSAYPAGDGRTGGFPGRHRARGRRGTGSGRAAAVPAAGGGGARGQRRADRVAGSEREAGAAEGRERAGERGVPGDPVGAGGRGAGRGGWGATTRGRHEGHDARVERMHVIPSAARDLVRRARAMPKQDPSLCSG